MQKWQSAAPHHVGRDSRRIFVGASSFHHSRQQLYCDGFERWPRPFNCTSFSTCVCASGCRVITIRLMSTSRILPGTPSLPAEGHGVGPAEVSQVYLKIGCGAPPGNIEG